MTALTDRARRLMVDGVERLGMRERALAVRGRMSPSPEVRRDSRDVRHLRVVIATALGGGGLALDVGAHRGDITRVIVAASPLARHVVVEPLPGFAARLVSEFPSCDVRAVAVGAERATATIVEQLDRPTRSSLRDDLEPVSGRTATHEVEVWPIDELVGDQDPVFVKIDVEGLELDSLRGMVGTLDRCRPVVVFEHRPTPATRQESVLIHGLLTAHDYVVFDIDGRGPFDKPQFSQVAAEGKVWNFIAVPGRERSEPV